MHTAAFPYILLLGVLWGTTLVMSRFGVGQFDPVLFVALRLTIASLAFGLVYAVSRRRQVSRQRYLWRHAALLGVVGTAVPMTAIVSSLQFQSSGVTSLLVTTSPAFIVVAAHLFLPDEQLNLTKGMGVVLALGGAALLILRGETGLPNVTEANPLGYALVILGILAETTGAIYIRKKMQGLDAFDVTAVRLLAATVVTLPVALLWRGFDVAQVNGAGLLSLAYAALAGAFAAQLMAFYITRRFGATAFSLTSYVIPVVAAVAGVFVLGETITIWMLGGMVLIVFGIMLINRRQADQKIMKQGV